MRSQVIILNVGLLFLISCSQCFQFLPYSLRFISINQRTRFPELAVDIVKKSTTETDSDIAISVMTSGQESEKIQQFLSDQTSTSKLKRSKGDSGVFSRTNRILGLQKWLNEILILKGLYISILDTMTTDTLSVEDLNLKVNEIRSQTVVIVDICKELLYSGIPEQSLELYAAYTDLMVSIKSQLSVNFPVDDRLKSIMHPDVRLVILATRSHICMNDITGALTLLQSCARNGLVFDAESKSQIIADLAISSPQGLKASLHLRTSMLERLENINTNACTALLKGIWLHGLTPRKVDNTLLVDASLMDTIYYDLDDDISQCFHLSNEKALNLATEILEYNLNSRKGKSKRTHKIIKEYFHILFSVSRPEGNVVDSNFLDDEKSSNNVKSTRGLLSIFDCMEKYSINWDIHVADTLFEGCLSMDDTFNIVNIAQTMNQKKIYCHTSTCNALLSKYNENGDSESAYKFYSDVMKLNELCQPNSESIHLLLGTFMQSKKGLYYARILLADLVQNQKMDKKCWDFYISLQVMDGKHIDKSSKNSSGIISIIQSILSFDSSYQPNDDTILSIISTYFKLIVNVKSDNDDVMLTESIEGKVDKDGLNADDISHKKHLLDLLNLFEIMFQVEECRTKYKNDVLNMLRKDKVESVDFAAFISSIISTQGSNLSYSAFYLPPPSKITLTKLLELLKYSNLPNESIYLLSRFIELSSSEDNIKQDRLIVSEASSEKNTDSISLQSYLNSTSNSNDAIKATSVVSILSAINLFTKSRFVPDSTMFAIVMETCLEAKQIAKTFLLFKRFENLVHSKDNNVRSVDDSGRRSDQITTAMENRVFSIKPTRRIYRNLIQAFGLKKDIPSAMGVFKEMSAIYVPDIATLKCLLSLCVSSDDPTDLRIIIGLLENLSIENPRINLDVYSKDVLFQSYPDAISLGQALIDMEKQCKQCPKDLPIIPTSMTVLNVLVQTIRKDVSLSSLTEALLYLGSIGIICDADTMEYFRLSSESLNLPLNSPYSRHTNRQLLPNREKMRSLMDIDVPTGLETDLRLIDDVIQFSYNEQANGDNFREPYHESGFDQYKDIVDALLITLKPDLPDDDDDDDDDDDVYSDDDAISSHDDDIDSAHDDDRTIVLIDDNILNDDDTQQLIGQNSLIMEDIGVITNEFELIETKTSLNLISSGVNIEDNEFIDAMEYFDQIPSKFDLPEAQTMTSKKYISSSISGVVSNGVDTAIAVHLQNELMVSDNSVSVIDHEYIDDISTSNLRGERINNDIRKKKKKKRKKSANPKTVITTVAGSVVTAKTKNIDGKKFQGRSSSITA